MAPGYRNQSRRQNRTVDHDLFEGLPVRHWRRDFVTVAPPPAQEQSTSKNNIWDVELPHGMPKDYHLLPQHSQDLLRAARSGRIYKRPAPIEDDDVDAEGGEKPEKKEDDTKDKGFQAKAWKQVPRHLEGPDVEYLAKRRKGVITIGFQAPVIPTLTKATVKRIDAAGNEYVQDVVVPHGQQIEGELISKTEIPDPSIGTDGLVIQPTPQRRKPAARKKIKGPGRGRKKKLPAPISAPGEGQPIHTGSNEGGIGAGEATGVKPEIDGPPQPSQNEDTEMVDGSLVASDNDDSDDGEEGEDGDEDEDDGDILASPSKPPTQEHIQQPLPAMVEISDSSGETTDMGGVIAKEDDKSEIPVEVVALTTSGVVSPKVESSTCLDQPPADLKEAITAPAEGVIQQETIESPPAPLPPPPPNPTALEVQSAIEERQDEEAEERVLLDILEPESSSAKQRSKSPSPLKFEGSADKSTLEQEELDLQGNLQRQPEPINTQPETVKEPALKSELEIQETTTVDGDEDFPDLLGDLEKSLGNPVPQAAPTDVSTEAAVNEKNATDTTKA